MEKLSLKLKNGFQGNKPVCAYVRDMVDKSIAGEIFTHREYRSADKLIQSAGYPILDVGAHVGLFSLYCTSINPQVPVYAIEPEPENFEVLKKNLRLNNNKTVVPLSFALAGITGKRKLEIKSDNHNHRLLGVGEKSDVTRVVQAFSLADLLNKINLAKISLLKLDIEGAEFEVIKSFGPSDAATIHGIVAEYHDGKAGNHKILEQHLRELGFGVQVFPSKFDRTMGFIFAINKRFSNN